MKKAKILSALGEHEKKHDAMIVWQDSGRVCRVLMDQPGIRTGAG